MITLRPGDVFVSRDGHVVRVLTDDEQRELVRRAAIALSACEVKR